jgi:sulfite exporter TauE/SafE
MELWTAFLLGLLGSAHCAGMCGPLLLALSKAQPRTRGVVTGRVVYHLGRIGIYAALGLLAGRLGQAAMPAGFQRWLSVALGGVLLVSLLVPRSVPLAAPIWKGLAFGNRYFGALLQRRSLFSQVALGALNGLLPCGLVYVAATGAAVAGTPLSGAAYMALFGFGTWPMLFALEVAGRRLPLPPRVSLAAITRTAVLLMAVLLILRGLELGIPLLSPRLSAGAACH